MMDTVIFPGTIIAGADLIAVAIPTTDAEYDGEYEEGDPVEYMGEMWRVLEWNFEHNCFICIPFDVSISLVELENGAYQVIVWEFHRQIWNDMPEGNRWHDRIYDMFLRKDAQMRLF